MKYRKKPIVIEAFRFMIDAAAPDWFMDRVSDNIIITHPDGTCDINTLEGTMRADKGDYIILGVNGEVYPCKPDIFEKTYEEIDENDTKCEHVIGVHPERVSFRGFFTRVYFRWISKD